MHSNTSVLHSKAAQQGLYFHTAYKQTHCKHSSKPSRRLSSRSLFTGHNKLSRAFSVTPCLFLPRLSVCASAQASNSSFEAAAADLKPRQDDANVPETQQRCAQYAIMDFECVAAYCQRPVVSAVAVCFGPSFQWHPVHGSGRIPG